MMAVLSFRTGKKEIIDVTDLKVVNSEMAHHRLGLMVKAEVAWEEEEDVAWDGDVAEVVVVFPVALTVEGNGSLIARVEWLQQE